MSRQRRGFTLIELLVVVSIILLLVGISMPVLARARQTSLKGACCVTLNQLGVAMTMYQNDWRGCFPLAAYMPAPFITSTSYPGLPTVLKTYSNVVNGMKCSGDAYVYPVAGISYNYNNGLAGVTVQDTFFAKRLKLGPGATPVSYDCDGNSFVLTNGQTLIAPPFHLTRNVLFADSHVDDYSSALAQDPGS